MVVVVDDALFLLYNRVLLYTNNMNYRFLTGL